MAQRGLYQPQIKDEHIRNLYQWAKRLNVPMTHLLNTLIDHALVRLEQGVENVSEAAPTPYRRRKPSAGEEQMIRFALGRVVATPGALRALEHAEQLPAEFLDRHVNGDWGDVPDADKQENELSVEQGFRILSAYTTSAGEKIWILTEADRSSTTIMLPSEY